MFLRSWHDCLHTYFNSFMGRLKVNSENHNVIQYSIFQFLYGTIKRLRTKYTRPKLRNFNSFMGRLKADGAPEIFTERKEFQFLYGTIKSNNSISR